MSASRIVLIDEHDVVRAGVRQLLASSSRYQIVGEARTARAGLQTVEATRPDLVLIGIFLPGMDGVVATREILRRLPRTRVVVFSAFDEVHDVVAAMTAGALGYVRKADPLETLIQALDSVARGELYLAPTVAARLAACQKRRVQCALDVLSKREHEVFRMAADCHTPSEIAAELCLARKTVDTHLNRISRKLGVRGRVDLVRLAAGMGLVHSIRSAHPPHNHEPGTHTDAEVGSTSSVRH
jgi:DNA-binding NarL/FixJ family response regulator